MRTPALALIAVCLLSAGCTVSMDAEERVAREEKRFPVTGAADVSVSTFDGPIEIRSWDRSEVLVEIEKRAGDEAGLKSIEVRAEKQGNRVHVEAVRPSGSDKFVGIGFHVSPQAKLIVSVPKETTLEARSGDGSIRAEHLQGRVTLRTADGSVRAVEIKGELDIESGDGSITVDDADGTARLSTGDGGVTTSGRFDVLTVKSGDGSVTVRADRGSEAKSDWSITTEDGSVALYLPEGFSGEIDARTGDGTVRSEFDVQGAERDDAHRRSLRGRIGAVGNVLRIRTGDGSISLRNW
ncbi:MAG: DUF4097 family beta strand repeat-containing protein [Acidobacteriota bacterium]